MIQKQIPFDFLLDYLPPEVVIKPAIGMYYLYLHGKIVLIFRKVNKNPHHNGLWIATKKEDHTSLKAQIPAITNFVFEEGEDIDSAWLQLKETHDDFEEAAISICALVSKKDPRIGKTTARAKELTR